MLRKRQRNLGIYKDIMDSNKIKEFLKNENFLNVEQFFKQYEFMPAGRNPDFDDLMQDFYTKGFLSQVMLRLREEDDRANAMGQQRVTQIPQISMSNLIWYKKPCYPKEF